MRAVVADLALEYEAAVALAARVAVAFGSGDGQPGTDSAFARLAVAVAKFWLTKRCPAFVYECMECHGGVGYVEETPLPRLYREAPVNAIWEGSGNVIALDVLRTLRREPAALAAFADELAAARGADRAFDAAAAGLLERLARPVEEAEARGVVERMALLLQAALLLRHAPPAVADAFCATRLADGGGRLYGILPAGADVAGILSRQRDD